MVVGRRRHARADARPFDGGEGQELPVVVQRPGPGPSRRPPRHRHRRRWPRQPQRPGALPHVNGRGAVPTPCAFSRMAATAASPSSSPRSSAATASSETAPGDGIASVARASSMRSRGARTGASFATIDDAAVSSSIRSGRLPSSTASASKCGTALRPPRSRGSRTPGGRTRTGPRAARSGPGPSWRPAARSAGPARRRCRAGA